MHPTDKKKRQRGSLHIFSIIIILLALVGAWYMVKGFQQHRLGQDMKQVMTDYKNWAMAVVKSPADRREIQKSFENIERITNKYNRQPQPYYNQQPTDEPPQPPQQ